MRQFPGSAREPSHLASRSHQPDASPLDDLWLPSRDRKPDPARLLALQRTIGNAATARILRDASFPERGRDREKWDQNTEERRDASRPDRRGDRRGDPTAAFDTDWAGRAILSHYLYGNGEEAFIRNNPEWTEYMTASDRLRKQNEQQVLALAAEILIGKKMGKQNAFKRYHAEVENGEGMIGYQYLHGTNSKVGDFEIFGTATVSNVEQPGVDLVPGQNPYAPDVLPHEAGQRIDFELTYVWNDIIDPNVSYISDTVKDWFAELISLGDAESYKFSVGWKDTCTVFQAPKQHMQIVGGYPTE
jgi:hypothetical protein